MADLAQRPKELPKQPKVGHAAEVPKNVQKKTSEAAEVAPSQVEDIKSQTHEPTATGTQNGDNQTNDEFGEDEEGTEALGSVDGEGRVVDEEGRVVGQ